MSDSSAVFLPSARLGFDPSNRSPNEILCLEWRLKVARVASADSRGLALGSAIVGVMLECLSPRDGDYKIFSGVVCDLEEARRIALASEPSVVDPDLCRIPDWGGVTPEKIFWVKVRAVDQEGDDDFWWVMPICRVDCLDGDDVSFFGGQIAEVDGHSPYSVWVMSDTSDNRTLLTSTSDLPSMED